MGPFDEENNVACMSKRRSSLSFIKRVLLPGYFTFGSPEKRRMAEAVAVAEAARNEEPKVFLVGINNSEGSFFALDWTLRHHFSGEAKPGPGAPASKLVVVYAKPTPSSVIGLGGLGLFAFNYISFPYFAQGAVNSKSLDI